MKLKPGLWLQARVRSDLELVLDADGEGVGLDFAVTNRSLVLGKLQTGVEEGALGQVVFCGQTYTGAPDIATRCERQFGT